MKRLVYAISPLSFLILTLSAHPTHSAIINVPADQPTIQAGIDAASDGDLVFVASGSYIENIDFLGKAITVKARGGADLTVIDGGQCRASVTFISGETGEAVLEGFTITNGTGNPGPFPGGYYGGGIFCDDHSSPTIRDCTITGNQARSGGGIYCCDSDPEITNCTIFGNHVTQTYSGGGCGGGIYCSESSPRIASCTISGNTIDESPGAYLVVAVGGGISTDSSDLMIDDCTITGNDREGIACWYESSQTVVNCTVSENGGTGIQSILGGSVEVMDCTISENGGRGIYCVEGIYSTIMNSSIAANCAEYGGGIYCSGSTTTIANCVISGNSTDKFGGGIHCIGGSSTVVNCVISGNRADRFGGGGIYWGSGSHAITNSTIAGNNADYGGGICSDWESEKYIQNCILRGDSARQGHELWIGIMDPDHLSILTVSYSDVQGGATEAYIELGATLIWAEGNIDADPLFAGPADYRLSTGSPCIDAGDPAPIHDDSCLPPSLGAERNDMGTYGGPGACGWCGDRDGDGFESMVCGGEDCDDVDATANPSMDEICDGVDNDCDGSVDEDFDRDFDGWTTCDEPVPDCDDTDHQVNPGHDEVPGNGKDDDCDGLTDEPCFVGVVM